VHDMRERKFTLAFFSLLPIQPERRGLPVGEPMEDPAILKLSFENPYTSTKEGGR